MGTIQDFRLVLDNNVNVSADEAIFRDDKNFKVGSLSTAQALLFWEEEILQETEINERRKILRWLKDGVRIEDFLKTHSKGIFKKVKYSAKYPPARTFDNYVEDKHVDWVNTEVEKLLQFGAVKKWSLYDPVCSPVIIAPIQVEEGTHKNRLIYNAQYLNCFMDPPTFTMDGVGKIAEVGWKGMFLFSIDHKNGYYHVMLHESAWKYFGFVWMGEVYIFIVLCFGWSPGPFIYSTLTEKVAGRIRKVTSAPVLTWIDDNLGGNSVHTQLSTPAKQLQSARQVCFISCMIMFYAGYYVNIEKSVLDPATLQKHLGIMIDTIATRFYVPSDRIENLLNLIRSMLESGYCSLGALEKCVGKCRSMAIAVPGAILYTRAQYTALTQDLDYAINPGAARRQIIIFTHGSELVDELEMWLQLGAVLEHGGMWIEATRVYLSLRAHTDASARRWGGIFKSPKAVFITGGDFAEEQINLHINVKEAVALEGSLQLFCQNNSEEIKGRTVVVNVDNKTLYHIYENGGSTGQVHITSVCKKLFWLQTNNQFKLKLQWIPSGENEADGITRESVDDDIRLHRKVFNTLWKEWGGIFRDLMASSGNVQFNQMGEKLPFFSRYHDKGTLGVDVFAQNITRNGEARWPDFCFPPYRMIGKFLEFAKKSGAWCIVVVPEEQCSWFHLVTIAAKKTLRLSERKQQGSLLKFRTNALRTFCSRHAMIAVELDFRCN